MSINNKQWLGLPLNLLWGYIAIAVFMTGDGFELAFLSHYIKALGFSPAEASFAFTLYGLAPRCRRGFPAWWRKLSPR
ncbi:ribitol/Xylitol/Arabitol transporter [Klebsiella pneumoniae]|uniref:Ribitol/Xylitol/Arabitol transporter n=1 Tax=Klebsiella pneumoniae TaxID=573 RepID=A0A2X3ISU6_KLEPN|nr:ribitol/Xylitol/Arabitol transporter [Klebsiella pneumoniae]